MTDAVKFDFPTWAVKSGHTQLGVLYAVQETVTVQGKKGKQPRGHCVVWESKTQSFLDFQQSSNPTPVSLDGKNYIPRHVEFIFWLGDERMDVDK